MAISTLKSMLTLATTYKTQRYILEKTEGDFRTFEAEVAINNNIQGTGVVAKRDSMSTHEFFFNKVALGSHELGAYINSFPLKAATASYLFTILEVFGNDIAEMINPGHIDRNKAWHEDVKGFADMRDPVQVQKAREAFAKHFAVSVDDVPEIAARRIVNLKYERNEFAHGGSSRMNFDNFLCDALAVLCHIVFLTTDEDRIAVYPWEDHEGTFNPLSSA